MDNKTAWEFAIGILKVDGLEPSPELLELIEKEIRGEINSEDITRIIKEKYSKRVNESEG